MPGRYRRSVSTKRRSRGPAGNFTVYNLVPPPGVAAQFGFHFNGTTNMFLDARVRSGGDNGITEHVNVPQLKVVATRSRFGVCRVNTGRARGRNPFLTLPTSCGEPPLSVIEMFGSWQDPEATPPAAVFPWHDNEGTPVGITGCEKLVHFHPSISLAPDTSTSDSPAGLTATVACAGGFEPGRAGDVGVEGNDGCVA